MRRIVNGWPAFCDAPFVPINLVERLHQAVYKQGADIGCAVLAEDFIPFCAVASLPPLLETLNEKAKSMNGQSVMFKR